MSTVEEMQKLKLTSKIRMVVHPQKLVRFSKKHLWLYTKYAAVVFKTLRKPLFQKFLNWMTKRKT